MLDIKRIRENTEEVKAALKRRGTDYSDKIDEENILRTIAVFKIANPISSIRLAGGKKARLSQKNIQLLIDNCIDSAIVGNYLTTTGFSPEDDKQKVKKAGKILKTI